MYIPFCKRAWYRLLYLLKLPGVVAKHTKFFERLRSYFFRKYRLRNMYIPFYRKKRGTCFNVCSDKRASRRSIQKFCPRGSPKRGIELWGFPAGFFKSGKYLQQSIQPLKRGCPAGYLFPGIRQDKRKGDNQFYVQRLQNQTAVF